MFELSSDETKEIRRDYRACFSTAAGRRVLCHMLAELHFFDEIISSEEERVRSNYARRILDHMGVLKGIHVPDIINSFLAFSEEMSDSA